MTDAGVAGLVEQAVAGRPRAVARLISLIEDGGGELREAMAALVPRGTGAYVLGLTGAPGVGKSTMTNALVSAFRKRGDRVGVLAVDPTSPFSGGALLGDRVRMQDHFADRDVYIRSMASRGHLGGLAAATVQAVRVLDAAGCAVVLIETVGVGQSEVEIASAADTTTILLAPGMGDAIQTAKAGLFEVGDIYCVNKADRDGADQTVREVNHMLGLGERRGPGDWRPSVVRTIATDGDGLDELVEAIDKHHDWLSREDRLAKRRRQRVADEIEALALATLSARMGNLHGDQRIGALADRVVAGDLDPYAAADELVSGLTGNGR